MSMSKLEDFGVKAIATPEQRLMEYKAQCRGTSKRLQAKFWLMILEKDIEVAKLVVPNYKKHRGKRISEDDLKSIPLELVGKECEGE